MASMNGKFTGLGKSHLLALLAIFVLSFSANYAIAQTGNRDPMTHFFHQGFDDLQEELKIAKKNRKLGLLIMFDDPNCPWCARMKETVLNQVRIQEYFRKYFRITRVDTAGDSPLIDFSGREVAQKDFAFKDNRVRATPVFKFYDLKGHEIGKFTGATKDADTFLLLGQYIVEGHYKKMPFTAYKRSRSSKPITQ